MEIAYNPTTEEIIEAPNQMSAARLAELGLSTIEAPPSFKASRHEDYKVVDDAAVVAKSDSEKLPAIQAAALAEIDRQAEEALKLVAAVGPGQAMIYQAKEQEALKFKAAADPDPDPADYPFLAAEKGRTKHPATGAVATTMDEMADIIIFTAAVWRPLGAAVEGVRRTAKFAVETADQTADPAATIQATLDGLTWPDVSA